MVFCNIGNLKIGDDTLISHNPYFNRWFSAMKKHKKGLEEGKKVTILILIDGFLQYEFWSC